MKAHPIKSIIIALFEQFVDWSVPDVVEDKSNQSNYGLAVTLDLGCNNFGYESDGNTHHAEWERSYRKFIHVIVLRPRMCFVAVTEQPSLSSVSPEEFVNTSNHDSCWRTDGLHILSDECRKAYKHCFEFMPEEHQRTPAHTNLSLDFSIFGKPINFVCVTHTAGLEYWKKLQTIEKAPYAFCIKAPAPRP